MRWETLPFNPSFSFSYKNMHIRLLRRFIFIFLRVAFCSVMLVYVIPHSSFHSGNSIFSGARPEWPGTNLGEFSLGTAPVTIIKGSLKEVGIEGEKRKLAGKS